MRFLLIVLLAFLLVRLVASCNNNGRTSTANPANSPLSTSIADKRR
jgi:hypothetical protein